MIADRVRWSRNELQSSGRPHFCWSTACVILLALAPLPNAAAYVGDWVIGTDAVVNVRASSDAEPIAASIPLALDQSIKLQKAYPKVTQWIVNVDWPSASTGVQFILKGNTASFEGTRPEAWIGRFSFNGGSEKGVVEAGKWCLRGAMRTYPGICQGVDKAVASRNIRHLIKL